MQWKNYLKAEFDLAGVDQNESVPIVRMTYRALNSKGEVKDFDTQILASNFGKSVSIKNVEDQAKHDVYWATRREIEAKAHTFWYNDLRVANSCYNDKTFGIIYSKAYQDGHSSGHDSVKAEFDDLSSFVDEIIEANPNPSIKRKW